VPTEPVPAPDLPRAIVLEGVSNLRDLGGWPVAGGRVRHGRVFRAAALVGLTAADAERLSGLGLATICDLRGRAEATAAPTPHARLPGVRLHALPIEPSVGAGLRDILATGGADATGEQARQLMRQAYVAYASDWSHHYRTLFDLLVDPAGPPLLFHCSAGKDRTGFAAALILTALGATRETVKADYLATRTHWRGDAEMAAGLPPDLAAALLGVDAALLDAAFAAVDAAHGSFAAYAAERLGLDPPRLARLRATLVEPA
jgi:protein-tyrosine phosphatase